jgi:hypothetical protein
MWLQALAYLVIRIIRGAFRAGDCLLGENEGGE